VKTAVALALMGLSTAAIAQPASVQPRLHELLDRGFEMAAEGPLLESVVCRRWTMRVIPRSNDDGCVGAVTYGSFKRLKNGVSEFVCVSFREWACYQSDRQS
jgi:hypothetical protein